VKRVTTVLTAPCGRNSANGTIWRRTERSRPAAPGRRKRDSGARGQAGRHQATVSLGDFTIVYFGNDWFAENRTSSHHIAERLSHRTRVLYVDVPGLRAPKANGRVLRKLSRTISSIGRPPQRVADRLWHMSVPQIPFRRFPLVQQVNAAAGRLLVKRALERLGFARTVSWFAVPHQAPSHAFKEAAVVYTASTTFTRRCRTSTRGPSRSGRPPHKSGRSGVRRLFPDAGAKRQDGQEPSRLTGWMSRSSARHRIHTC
jgi:hypothetical protein